jgi:hypothetical protein
VGESPVLTPWSASRLSRRVSAALGRRNFEQALRFINIAVHAAAGAARQSGQLCYGSREIDVLCLAIGERIAAVHRPTAHPAPPAEKGGDRRPLDLFVASELYAGGGHTALLGDYMAGTGDRRRLLALTDVMNRAADIPWSRLGIAQEEAAVCRDRSLLGKSLWLMELLARHRPERVFIFTHPQDSAAIAACQPLRGAEFFFIHHVDRLPSLGAFAPGMIHIDVTPFCFSCCRHAGGHDNNRYLPIVAADLGARRLAGPEAKPRPLLSAACGSAIKFRLDRSDLYGRALATILAAGGGEHLHIGELPPEQLAGLRAALKDRGIDPARLHHIAYTPSLWRCLDEEGVDLYIGSLPDRGARAYVEAMGSATPAIWHVSHEQRRFHDTHMKYPEAAVWQDFEELTRLIRSIDAQWLQHQSQAARRQFERWYHPDLLARQLSGPALQGCMPPAHDAGAGEPRLIALKDLPASWRDRFKAHAQAARLRFGV